jgi:membrane-anchored mycosin MYCP
MDEIDSDQVQEYGAMHDRVYEYRASEFVVATQDRDVVMRSLDGTQAQEMAQIRELGLSLITLPDVRAAARKVQSARENLGAKPPAVDRTLADRLPMERLLGELRALLGYAYGGWEPTLGKNRVVHGLQIFPYPSFGGEDVPVALPASTRMPMYAANPRVGADARVVVLDTPIYANDRLAGRYLTTGAHSLLAANGEVRQWWAGHATFIAGMVLQRAPAARLEIESVLGPDGAPVDVWEVARRLVRYADSGADVLNLSFGCFTVDGKAPLVLERAIARLTPRVVVVAAAGNYGERNGDPDRLPKANTPVWPAAFPEVVAVGATERPNHAARFTPKVPWMDFLAPGVSQTSTYLDGTVVVPDRQRELDVRQNFSGMAKWSGTSHAAAAVSGAIAARIVRGRRSARQALEDLRNGVNDASSSGIEVAQLPPL